MLIAVSLLFSKTTTLFPHTIHLSSTLNSHFLWKGTSLNIGRATCPSCLSELFYLGKSTVLVDQILKSLYITGTERSVEVFHEVYNVSWLQWFSSHDR